jgi:pyrroloquinoline quinone (PQQ) biosynthesis protein C
MNGKVELLLSFYEEFPFENHPLWRGVLDGTLSLPQVLRAEVQHWIRTKFGQPLRRAAVEQARDISPRIFKSLNETYLDECTDEGGANHLILIERLVVLGGVSKAELEDTKPTPGNSAAMAIYQSIGSRGFGCHMIGAGAVEHYYSLICPTIYKAYTEHYGMTPDQAETYSLHGPMDQEHASRAFDVLDEVVELHGWPAVEQSVRDAFVGTSLHYDGMLQAASGDNNYWNGRRK